MAKTTLTHGENRSPLHYMWLNIKKRCRPDFIQHKDYADRGITVCDEWKEDFWAFRCWAVENGYEKGLTIDRIDNDKGYSPDNCRFVDRYVQANNTRKNRFITIDGETKTVAQWARVYGVNPDLIHCRIRRGWSEQDAVTVPSWTYSRAHDYHSSKMGA